ncbi:serine hydrolase domain-containing protein [Streptomyces canus]|uniref:serine hydrolase domain-containing protein n=1 Tax=Streptomyces canus TaxID=58343 RepID=UPI0033A871CE
MSPSGVWRDGREVVRLNACWADAGRGRPWRDDALVMPYSLSKSFVTLTALAAVREGALRQVLTHRSGRPRFPAEAAGRDLSPAQLSGSMR